MDSPVHTRGGIRDLATAEQLWEQAKATYPASHRRGEGAGLRLAYMDIPRTEGVQSRGVKRSLGSAAVVDSERDFHNASRLVSTASIGRSLTDVEFQEVGGSVFRSMPSLAQGPHNAQSLQSAAMIPRGIADTNLTFQDIANHPSGSAGSAGDAVRALGRQPSDPAAPGPVARTSCCKSQVISAKHALHVCCSSRCFTVLCTTSSLSFFPEQCIFPCLF